MDLPDQTVDNAQRLWQLDILYPTDTECVLKLIGCWCVAAHIPPIDEVQSSLKQHPDLQYVSIDTQEVSEFDSAMVVWLLKVEALCQQHDVIFNRDTMPEGVQRLFKLSKEVPPRGFVHKAPDKHLFGIVGDATVSLWYRAGELLGIVGAALVGLGRFVSGRSIFVKRDILRFIQNGGPEALGIISLVSFLIGITLAVIGVAQLQKFGAEVYIANIEVVGILRELGCLMTGIVMAGRNAAAYAAEIGAMQVHEEIDALHSLAISRIDFLVMPRVIAMVITLPLLVVYANVIANIGGVFFSVAVMKMSYLEYMTQARLAFEFTDLLIGIGKAFVFGYLIAISGCLRGMQCGRSVSQVGDAATSAVVLAMVLIILSNVIIDMMLFSLGI